MRFKIFKRAETDPVFNRVVNRSLNPRTKINIFRHRWNPPSWPYIEPTKDATADLIRESNMLISPRRRCQERNADYDELVHETIEDRALAIGQAITRIQVMNQQFGLLDDERVRWRDLAPLPAPERVSITLSESGPQPAGTENTNDD